MANDYLKKEPSKTEKVLYELYMRQEQFDRSLYTTSAHVVALGILLDIKPEKIAQMLVEGNDKIRDYGKAINTEIERLDKENHKGHDHGPHDGHNHDHKEESGDEKKSKENQAK